MILLANFLSGIAMVLDMFLFLFVILVIARAVLSWVNPDPYNPLVRFITLSTEPLIAKVRKYLPKTGGPVDWAPLVLLAGLFFLQIVLVQSLKDYALEVRKEAILSIPK